MRQLANRMNVSRQNISLLEKREAEGTITLNSLRELGESMELRLVYGFVSQYESLQVMIDKKAEDAAKQIVLRTNNTMILEDQKVDETILRENIHALAEEIKRELPKYLWDR